jgi:hypothetical protein
MKITKTVRITVDVDVTIDELPDDPEYPEFRARLQRLLRFVTADPERLRHFICSEALCLATSELQECGDSIDALMRITEELPDPDDVSFYREVRKEGLFAEQVQELFMDDDEVVSAQVVALDVDVDGVEMNLDEFSCDRDRLLRSVVGPALAREVLDGNSE